MSATPETYRGVLKNAEKCYTDALKYAQHAGEDGYVRDKDGFIVLQRLESFDDAIENLTRMEGFLSAKIDDFPKKSDSPKKLKYEEHRSKIHTLIKEIKAIRSELRHR